METGNYYCQNIIFNEKGLVDIGRWLAVNADPSYTKEVLVIGDPSPSTALYYLQRKGLRFAPDFDSMSCRGIWNKRMELEGSLDNPEMQWKWPWDYTYSKRRSLGYVVVRKDYRDSLNISSYIVDIEDERNVKYSSGEWNLFVIPSRH
jgi:hypothetical protein